MDPGIHVFELKAANQRKGGMVEGKILQWCGVSLICLKAVDEMGDEMWEDPTEQKEE
jgi:hypothetical protein